MTPAAAAILDGMPDPSLLHRADRDGTTWILAGSVVLACYPSGDAGLRNVAVAVCRQLGFSGRAVAEVMGLTENYVATLHNRALREGTAGLVRARAGPQAGRERLGAGGPVAGRGRLRQRDRPAAAGRPVHGVPPPGPGRRAGAAARRRAGAAGGRARGRACGTRAGRARGTRAAGGRARGAGAGAAARRGAGSACGSRARARRRAGPAARGRPGGPAGRRAGRLRTARSPAGMRGRCWPTPTTSGSARRRSWRPRCRPPWAGRGMTTWRC